MTLHGIHLSEGQAVDERGAGFGEVLHVLEVAAPLLAELHDGAHVVGRRDDLHPERGQGESRGEVCGQDVRSLEDPDGARGGRTPSVSNPVAH